MTKNRYIFLFLLFVGFALTVNARDMYFPTDSVITKPQDSIATITLTITINDNTDVELENVVKKGYLDVYNLLGVKATSVNLKKCTDDKCNIRLSKGIYILKAGKVAKKIIIR